PTGALSRSASNTALSDALDAVKNKVAHFEAEGLRKTNFTLGVCNLALTAFVVGKWPEHYWVLYLFKAIFMVVYKLFFVWYPEKLHYFFLDFCWITNGGFFVMFLLILVNVCSPSVTQTFFLIFFAVANGPLAWSVIALGNKLVFHNFEWTSTLFIHFSPALASWGIHWNKAAVLASVWGDRFETLGDESAASVFTTGYVYYLCWWVLFTAWMLTRGLRYPEQGYDTVFNALKNAHNFDDIKPFKGRGLRTQIVIYMALHLVGCTVAFAWSMACWSNIWVHTAFLALAFLKATVEGSSWYLYAIQRASIKQIQALIDKEDKPASNKV
ncbi:hypothetical protein TeGR_g13022, partial [Tetraparma gracilis]